MPKTLCDIAECIEDAKGLKTGGVSPSDTIALKISNKYLNNYSHFEAFMKLYINPDIIPQFTLANEKILIEASRGLLYEQRIYSEIIKKIIDERICPNFVGYVADTTNCSPENIIKIIERAGVNRKDAVDCLMRSTIYMLHGFISNVQRPSITDPFEKLIDKYTKSQVNLPLIDLSKLRYNFFITENIPGAKGFLDWYYTVTNAKECFSAIFQTLIACYALTLYEITHNDLHMGNIFVSNWKQSSVNVTYLIDNQYYTIENTSVKSLIYDFDRAYCESYGDNPNLSKDLCDYYSQCNKFIPNKDMLKFLSSIHSLFNDRGRKMILDTVSPEEFQPRLKDYFESGYLTKNFKAMPVKFYKDYYNPLRIVQNFAEIFRIPSSKSPPANTEHLYIL